MAVGIEGISNSEGLGIVSRAIKQGWAIPAAAMQALPAVLFKMLADPKTKPRERLRAIQVLMKMTAQNAEFFEDNKQDGITLEHLMELMNAATAPSEPEPEKPSE